MGAECPRPRNHKCKGPEVGAYLVIETEQRDGSLGPAEIKGPQGPGHVDPCSPQLGFGLHSKKSVSMG